MPLYEYKCKKCGHQFEKIQKFSDPMVKKCPKCQGVVEQMVSSPAIRFKGSGWYVNDYAAKSVPKEGKEESAKPAEAATEAKAGDEKSKEKKKDSHHKDTKEKPKDTKKKGE